MKSIQTRSGKACRVPLPCWANVISLDAVAVGTLWNLIFTVQFCRRWPAAYELGIIGLSIWLVYTADRLFDSVRLDTRLPHSVRHRFHLTNRGWLILAWFVGLFADTAIIVAFANETQLRWGCAAIAMVVAYIAGVQLVPHSGRWIPKEFQVGVVFAFGVSLTAWSEAANSTIIPLLASTVMASVLFAVNCLAISRWERDLDKSQRFDSLSLRIPEVTRRLPLAMSVQILIAIGLFAIGALPGLVFGCLVASVLLLFSLVQINRGEENASLPDSGHTARADVFVALADFALLCPPLVWMIAGNAVA